MIEAEKGLYSTSSVVEVVRLYWRILADLSNLYNDPKIFAPCLLKAIDAYRKNVPKELQEKITFENLEGLEKLCHQMLNENKSSK